MCLGVNLVRERSLASFDGLVGGELLGFGTIGAETSYNHDYIFQVKLLPAVETSNIIVALELRWVCNSLTFTYVITSLD